MLVPHRAASSSAAGAGDDHLAWSTAVCRIHQRLAGHRQPRTLALEAGARVESEIGRPGRSGCDPVSRCQPLMVKVSVPQAGMGWFGAP